MSVRDSNPLQQIVDRLTAAINEITTMNNGEIPPANTKPGLVVGLLASVKATIVELLTCSNPSMTVEQITGLTEQLATASSCINEMPRIVPRTMKDGGSRKFWKAMDACQSNIIGAGTLIEELVVTFSPPDPAAVHAIRPKPADFAPAEA